MKKPKPGAGPRQDGTGGFKPSTRPSTTKPMTKPGGGTRPGVKPKPGSSTRPAWTGKPGGMAKPMPNKGRGKPKDSISLQGKLKEKLESMRPGMYGGTKLSDYRRATAAELSRVSSPSKGGFGFGIKEAMDKYDSGMRKGNTKADSMYERIRRRS